METDAELAVRLVAEAGRLAHDMRRSGLRAETKTSISDVVTAADRAAEALVVDLLTELRPEDGILGEEGSSRESSSGRTWVIDPVDGTYNFVQGLEWWCSAVALRDEQDVLLGAVHQPHGDLSYVGGADLPATRNGSPVAPIVDRPLAESCVTTYLHPPHYGNEIGAAFGRMVNGAATVRMLGSGTLDAMAVAQGQLHVLCQHSVPDWDWLPGAAIIRSVGGATAKVTAAGVEWSVAGAPTAVAEVCEALRGR